MNTIFSASRIAIFIVLALCAALSAYAEGETEITGFYQQYRDFSYKVGISTYDFPARPLEGGGFNIAQNIAPWFAMWTQFSFYGSTEHEGIRVRLINNLQGIRYQTQKYGPLRLYAKGGLGFTRYSMDVLGDDFGETKFSASYGGGAHLWLQKHFGLMLDVSQVLNGLPQLTESDSREKWDSGLTYTTGLTIRF